MKAKIIITYIVLVSFITGCIATYRAKYDIGLKEVERPAQAKERYGEKTITKVQEEGIFKYYFEDEMVKFIWIPSATEVAFVATNKTEHSIKILWDEAAYVDENGTSHRVMNSGIKYNERNNLQPPSIIVRKGTLNDIIIPTDYVYFYELGQYSSWKTEPLFPTMPKAGALSVETKEDLSARTKEYIGKTFQVLLPLEIEDVVNEYIFIFEIDDVLVE